MNERIKELYEQCFMVLENNTPNTGFDVNKFAELIVKECVEQVEVFNVRMDARPRHIIDAIKEHFGIKE